MSLFDYIDEHAHCTLFIVQVFTSRVFMYDVVIRQATYIFVISVFDKPIMTAHRFVKAILHAAFPYGFIELFFD